MSRRLQACLAQLQPADAEWLARYVETLTPRWAVRAERLAARDRVLRQMAVQLGNGKRTVVAHELETMLSRYLDTGWKRECNLIELPDDVDAMRALMHRFCRLNHGKALTTRRIFDLLQEMQ